MRSRLAVRVLSLLAAAGGLAVLPGCAAEKEEGFAAYGVVEATEVRVAPVIGGTVIEVCCREGESVEPGTTLVEIDTAEIALQLRQAQAQLRGAEAQAALVRKATRREDLVAAVESLRLAEVQGASADRDFRRVEDLHGKGTVPVKHLEDARAAVDMSTARLKQAQAQVAKLRRGARTEEIDAADALREQAAAAVALLEKRLGYGEIAAPSGGRIVYRMTEPGEVARPGVPLLVLADIAHPYADVYVSERRVGEVRLGQEVSVRADAFPERTFVGRVERIADEAEFTPKNVQTEDQRALLVFRVRLAVANEEERLKPGMPVRVDFDLARGAAPRGTKQ